MSGRYIGLAIDHGTSNSAIAAMDPEEQRVRIIKPDGVDDVMPSVVYITDRGRPIVGKPAYVKALTADPHEGDGVFNYKPDIGHDLRYEFKAANLVKTGPELGAMVIGELLNAYRQEYDDNPNACVITVPAKFDLNARTATSEAATMAGLTDAPLLQEPVAAATAYGFSTDDARAKWMIFDLGGGTLDVSLVFVRDGRFVVPDNCNAGDNHLGGRAFDGDLMEYVVSQLRAEYALTGFSQQSNRSAWNRLLLAVERAKIELSRHDRTNVQTEQALLEDDEGRPVDVDVPITREIYEPMLGTYLERAANICETLLRNHKLGPDDINRLILVGGPTKTPVVQRFLTERLGIELSKDLDPMTVVARGAAVFASTVQGPKPDPKPEDPVRLQLQYQSTSNTPTHWLVGKVEWTNGARRDAVVEVNRHDGTWGSEPIRVGANGTFQVELPLIERDKTLSKFTTTVKDGSGAVLCTVQEPEIWFKFPVIAPQLSNSLRVQVRDVQLERSETSVVIPGGKRLPAEAKKDFRLIRPMTRGSGGHLDVRVLEGITHLMGGEHDEVGASKYLGRLRIESDDERFSQDLPAEAELNITLKMDLNGLIHVGVYIPLLEDEFAGHLDRSDIEIDLEETEERSQQQRQRLDAIRSLQGEHNVDRVGEVLEMIDNEKSIAELDKELERARRGTEGAIQRASHLVAELTGTVAVLEDLQRPVRVERLIGRLKGSLSEPKKRELETLELELPDAEDYDLQVLEHALEQLDGS